LATGHGWGSQKDSYWEANSRRRGTAFGPL
jgi:hypothetical protein